jgi:hypothetical protein
VRSRPRDLEADSENRLQSARGRARARRRRRWRSRGARNLRAARALLAAPLSAALWRSESVWRPIRGARIGTRASASRLIDLTLASPRDPELCPTTASADPLRCWRGHLALRVGASPVCADWGDCAASLSQRPPQTCRPNDRAWARNLAGSRSVDRCSTTAASRGLCGTEVSEFRLGSCLRGRLYGNVRIKAIMGTLGLCHLGLRCVV